MSSNTRSETNVDDQQNATSQDRLLPATVMEREEKVRKNFWKKFRRFAGRIPFADDLVAAYYCALDTETPAKVRGTLLAALAYFILPTDLIPDFLVGFGMTDDITVLTAAISMVGAHIREPHRLAARRFLQSEQPDS